MAARWKPRREGQEGFGFFWTDLVELDTRRTTLTARKKRLTTCTHDCLSLVNQLRMMDLDSIVLFMSGSEGALIPTVLRALERTKGYNIMTINLGPSGVNIAEIPTSAHGLANLDSGATVEVGNV